MSGHPLVAQARAALRAAESFRMCLRFCPHPLDQRALADAWERRMQEARRCRLVATASRKLSRDPLPLNHRAIRALDAVRMRSEKLQRAEEGERCDALFDGGEWSGPAWGSILDDIERDLAEAVAQRFGMTGDQLLYQSMAAGTEHMEKLQLRQQVARGAREAEEERRYWAMEGER